MARTNTTKALLLVGVVAITSVIASATSLEVEPPNVLDSDLNTCECYQDDVYPSECPLSTPQLDQLCIDLSAYQYNQTQTEQFCTRSCLEALTSCYQLYPESCSASVLDYYKTSFCSRNEEGEYCVSVGFSALETISSFATRCSDADEFCPLPPEPCTPAATCTVTLNAVVSLFGCCAPSLLEHPLSPFANYSIGNTHAYTTCGVALGEKCPGDAEPSPLPSNTPSQSPGTGGGSSLSFKGIAIVTSLVCALCTYMCRM